jgi:hypothetical protein
VAEDEAERIELASSPELDQAMRTVFSASPQRGIVTQFATPSGDRWIRWRKSTGQITYKELPAAVAFDVVLRLPDGREFEGTATQRPQFCARAGSSGVFTPSASGLSWPEQPGRYDATLVLKPNLDLAYRDPRIKILWNGTLELPISFEIYTNGP